MVHVHNSSAGLRAAQRLVLAEQQERLGRLHLRRRLLQVGRRIRERCWFTDYLPHWNYTNAGRARLLGRARRRVDQADEGRVGLRRRRLPRRRHQARRHLVAHRSSARRSRRTSSRRRRRSSASTWSARRTTSGTATSSSSTSTRRRSSTGSSTSRCARTSSQAVAHAHAEHERPRGVHELERLLSTARTP